MRLFYFVGGPTAGNDEAFGRRLAELGGPPRGWQVYPFADGSGQALHLVTADAESSIDAHLANFAPDYERGPVIELVARGRSDPEAGVRP
jgi:hypothetical protein